MEQNCLELSECRPFSLHDRIRAKLEFARNVLLLGVGGGNDSISALLLRDQLEDIFDFRPERLTVAAMLPDVLTYDGLGDTLVHGISEILPASRRSLNGRLISAFPEPLLAANKDEFRVSQLLGISMDRGSSGVLDSLRSLIEIENYDLVIACDVGGDFIAIPENNHVLSPMMDSYALYAFRRLCAGEEGRRFLFGVFGLGTDGESTPEHLHAALARIDSFEAGTFSRSSVKKVEDFYRGIVHKNRHSRTADFTFRSIAGEDLNEVDFKARFHTSPSSGETKTYFGEFKHRIASEFAGRFYLFESLEGISNPFEFECSNGLHWFLEVHRNGARINHELAGQSYPENALLPGLGRLLFAIPSAKFPAAACSAILQDTLESIENGVNDLALVAVSDLGAIERERLGVVRLNDNLAIIHSLSERGKASAVLLEDYAKGILKSQ